ncbi:MAG: M24 family metallopeptidase [Opitutales bacterium]
MPAQLFYASSELSADVLYLSGCFIPDAFLLFIINGKKVAILSRLEIGRARREGDFDELLELEALRDEVAEATGIKRPKAETLVKAFAEKRRLKEFVVPDDFPVGLAFKLQETGLKIRTEDEPPVPQRLRKTDLEARHIAEGNRASAAGLHAAEKMLREATIEGSRLLHNGKALTSERLREAVDTAVLGRGAVASQTICACGKQACDPHNRGSGPLRPHELIIVDVFPRVSKTGYHGDMTRTFLKGRPNDAQRRLVETVRSGQQAALAKIKPGVDARTVHQAVVEHFEAEGYATEERKGTWVGFFHSTGHGLGLEVHEEPRISKFKGTRLKSGLVFTVEPGLYYPGIGGCRIEDVVRVTSEGYEMLSKYPYRWHLR